jgi:hypothetical protein
VLRQVHDAAIMRQQHLAFCVLQQNAASLVDVKLLPADLQGS